MKMNKMDSVNEMWTVDNYPWPNVIDPHNESVKRLEKRIHELEEALENIEGYITHDMEGTEVRAVLEIINKVRK